MVTLQPQEAEWLIAAGSDVRAQAPELTAGLNFDVPRGRGLYAVVGICALFDQTTRSCRAHDDPSRPDFCAEFQEGGEACLDARADRMVMLPMPGIRPPDLTAVA